MAQGIRTLKKESPSELLPDRGKGVRRTVFVHVYNAANVTAFFSHDKTLLQETLTQSDTNFGTQAGLPVGKNGGATPFMFQDWEGPMWATGSADGVQICIEEANG